MYVSFVCVKMYVSFVCDKMYVSFFCDKMYVSSFVSKCMFLGLFCLYFCLLCILFFLGGEGLNFPFIRTARVWSRHIKLFSPYFIWIPEIDLKTNSVGFGCQILQISYLAGFMLHPITIKLYF